MRLSVCMIVRDEEERLPCALQSVAGLADEIVVCDTGSVDRTPEIARAAGAHVIHFAWCEHFARACNAAFDAASGDWILWLDADERLTPESAEALRAAIAAPENLAALVRLRERNEVGEAWETLQPRLFRNRPDLRLRRRIFPHFDPPLEDIAEVEGTRFLTSSIVIEHERPTCAQRRLRALPLLEQEHQENPGDTFIAIELGRMLMTLGDPRGHDVLAGPMAQLAAASPNPFAPFRSAEALLEYAFLYPDRAALAGISPDTASALAERWFPFSAPLLWHAAQADWITRRLPSCARRLERLRWVGSAASPGQSSPIDPATFADRTALNLAACYVHLGRFAAAEELLLPLLETPAWATAARRNLALMAQLRPERSRMTGSRFIRRPSGGAGEPRKTERPAGR